MLKCEYMKATKSRKTTKGMTYKPRVRDPQQIAFLAAYNDPNSPTFGNALQSALKAGYTQQYAENITGQQPKWLQESTIDRVALLAQAEKNLHHYATATPENDTDKRLQVDVSKFVSERLGKQYYATRSESVNVHIQAVSEETKQQVNKALDDVL